MRCRIRSSFNLFNPFSRQQGRLENMAFEHDIMISYTWRDNQPPPMSKSEGWVSGFQEGLEFWLKQVMPRQPKVWRDKNQMAGNKVFSDELHQVVSNSAILLAVLSEPYLSSEWCAKELQTFVTAADGQGGLEINNDYRIFKINKLPVDRKALPPTLTVVTGFDFFELDAETRVIAPIDPSFGETEKQRFIRKVYDVAVAMARLLKQIELEGFGKDDDDENAATEGNGEEGTGNSTNAKPAEPIAPGLTVFLPFTTRDQREVREDLVAELTRRNCKILPEEQTALEDVEAFKQAVKADLEKADLAIHLIGARYGTVLEGETRSVTELQNQWAAEESRKRGLKRLIWLPKNIGELTGQQFTFVDCLRTDRNALEGADFLEDTVENMKGIVLEMIKPKPKPQAEDPSASPDEKKLYIWHDESDKDAVRELRKALRDKIVGGQPLKILLPVFDGDAASLREIQRQRLQECDAVLIFWGGSSQAWVESCLGEIRKAPGFGRTQKFASKHLIYLGGTKTSAKEDWSLDFQDGLLEPDVATVEGFDSIATAALDQFIQTIQ